MKLNDVKDALNLKTESGEELLNREIKGGYTSDLLSDVMANASEGDIWITLQTHQNVVAVASLLGLSAVIITGGSKPEDNTLEKAKKAEVPILSSQLPSFELSGKAYAIIGSD